MRDHDPALANVSVIMPSYNAAATIGRALASIAQQTLRPLEVIVVDDGSADGTIEAARACRSLMNGVRLRILAQKHAGAGAARNQAINRAVGRYLAFLDADDEWFPEKLERSLAHLRSDRLSMVAHNIVEVSSDGESRVDCCARWRENIEDPLRTLYVKGFISSSTVVVERSVVVEAGGFNSTLPSAQDYDLWLTLLSRPGLRFGMFEDALLRYNLTTSGITGRIEDRRRCNMAVLRSHMSSLRSSRGPVVRLVLMRAAIVQLETVRAYWKRRQYRQLLWSALQAPWAVMAPLATIPWAPPYKRDFLSGLSPCSEITD